MVPAEREQPGTFPILLLWIPEAGAAARDQETKRMFPEENEVCTACPPQSQGYQEGILLHGQHLQNTLLSLQDQESPLHGPRG